MAKHVTALDTGTMTRAKNNAMMKTKSLLSFSIQRQVTQKIPLSRMIIHANAKSLYDDIKSESIIISNEETFETSPVGLRESRRALICITLLLKVKQLVLTPSLLSISN